MASSEARPGRSGIAALFAALGAAVAAASLCSGVAAAADEQPPSCASIPAFHRLDFWLGSWRVVDANGQFAGRDVVSSILNGCAITESWTDADGSHGLGVLHYDVFANEWRKLYLTDQAAQRGGIRERVLVADAPGGGVRFQGLITRSAGTPVLNRVTITPLPDGRLHYVVASSTDGGEHWNATFDVFYLKER
jgi:hypothetical protein